MNTDAPLVVLKEGYLSKRCRASRAMLRFQRRYIRLYAGELQYFHSPQDTVARRRVPLRLDSKVMPTNDQGYPRCFVIKATPTSENFYLQAEREEEKEEWVTAVYNALRRTTDIAEEFSIGQTPAPSSPKSTDQTPPSASSQPQPPARVLLHLNVPEAQGLKAVDLNGKSDPYCVINLVAKDGTLIRSEEAKTNYVTDNLNPRWNQNFVIGNAVDLSTVEAIHAEVFDHDHLMKNTSLGFVRIPLSVFQMSPASTGQSELVDNWFRIEPPHPTAGVGSAAKSMMAFATGGSARNESLEKDVMMTDHGKLHLVMSIAGPNLVRFFQTMHVSIAPQSRIVTDGYEHTDNRLEVTVIAARELIAADFNKSSDPFVELTLLDGKGKPIRGEYYRTAVIEKSRNPQWADEQYVFGRICRIDEAAKLRVRVLDWDVHSKNDPLGQVVIDLDNLSAHTLTEWYELKPETGMAIQGGLGSIRLKIALFGETRGERMRRRTIDQTVASKTHELSVEQLELENAQHELHDAACRLDGARISCAVDDYQVMHPQFYGINGCLQYLNSQLPRAHRETLSTDEGFQSRAGIESQAVLEITVLGTSDVKKDGTAITATVPYAVIEMDPAVCVEECKRVSAPQSPQKIRRTDAATSGSGEGRAGLFAKRAQAEVSARRVKLNKNEVRSEQHLDLSPDQLTLRVEMKSGHGLMGVDYGGYSDPYCTLTVTDRSTGKPVDTEKKRTAVISKTLNPVWQNEVFFFGQNFPLVDAGMLIIHVKDHNMTRSTPLGHVQIPISDLCHASAASTSISSTAKEKRYPLVPEPWMKHHAQCLGELCIKTEVVGDATLLAEMLQRAAGEESPSKMLSFLSMQSFTSEANLSASGMSSLSLGEYATGDEETTEIIEKGKPIRTSYASGTSATWRKEKFTLSLSYPGMFSTRSDSVERHVLHLRVFRARSLLGATSTLHSQQNKQDSAATRRLLGRRAETNAHFTVIPVLANGQLEHAEKKQSFTVYGTRNPTWPEQDFVIGKHTSLHLMSYLSLHVYTRDLDGESTRPIAQLLDDNERAQTARLKRFQVCKVGPTGVVEDDGFEVLPFDQRVLAYRKSADGGRFLPARVQKYRPFPDDEYEVLFEDGVESIDDLWDVFSLDYKGKIESIHADGTVDVSIVSDESENTEDAAKNYAKNVPMSLLKPVDAFTSDVTRVLARQMDYTSEGKQRWTQLQHTLTSLKLDVLSATGLPKLVARPGCLITFLGNPLATPVQEVCEIDSTGQLKAKVDIENESMSQKAREILSFVLPFHCDAEDVHNQKRFEEKQLSLGIRTGTDLEDESALIVGKSIVMQTATLLIRIVDQGSADVPSATHHVIGYARVDLATLQHGTHDLSIKLLPHDDVDYYKFVGSIALRVDCGSTSSTPKLAALSEAQGTRKQMAVCGASQWYKDRAAAEVTGGAASPRAVVSPSTKTPTLTRIGRRKLLRHSLTPTENAQVDAFHAVLVVIMKRAVSIINEIQRFEEFEHLAVEDMPKFHHIHLVNPDPNSEWIGRLIAELNVEARKAIVVALEMELLDMAASDWKRVVPPADVSREEWVKMRAVRQQELRKVDGGFIQDRTSAVILHMPWCFTGEGIISWVCRAPPILWKDQWVKYCSDATMKETCKLAWNADPAAKIDPDAMQAPRTREAVLLWLSALSDAGYIENITPSLTTADANKKYYLVEDKPDRFYRLHEVERWMLKKANNKHKCLSPLDLVPEMDCYQQLDMLPVLTVPASPSSSPRSKKTRSSSAAALASAAQVPDEASVNEEHLAVQKKMYAKRERDHVEGFLGLQNAISSFLFSQEAQEFDILKTVANKTQELVFADQILWKWKYAVFVPIERSLYIYDSEYSLNPTIIVDMSSTVCHAAYNFTNSASNSDKKKPASSGGWFNVVNATVLQKVPGEPKYEAISDELKDKLMKVTADGSLVIEFKTANAQLWVQSFVRAGVRVDMKPRQLVVLKRLNPTVLQMKCIAHLAYFDPKDLDGSFQRLLNKFFKHDVEHSHQEHERKMPDLRARIRTEMKKPGAIGDSVMAYYGKGQQLNPKPTRENLYTRGALYSGRIVRIRTPFVDDKYRFTSTYKIDTAPTAMQTLLEKYNVTIKESWLALPKATRDVFLLYDIEYHHNNEMIIEEGMLREHVRTNDGDLDPAKVQERCTDLNLYFKPSDLEDCVTRMVMHMGGRKPLGCLKIPIKTVSPHRVMDVWYPLAPENEMTQKANLGQIRVQLRLEAVNKIVRSKKIPAILMKDIKEAAAALGPAKPLAVATDFAMGPLKALKEKLRKTAKRTAMSPTSTTVHVVSREPSFLKIRVLEGRKLIAADIRTSDPFVKIVLVRQKDDKEEWTKLKTEVKHSTLSPKWQNEEFVLGKSVETMLSDKKAVILRVMDYDRTSPDDPMGCLKLEFQRDKAGYITGLVLVHADENGNPTSRALQLGENNSVEVDEMLLADEKEKQSKSSSARGNNYALDGKLGRLRFIVEVAQNENFVDPTNLSASQMQVMMRSLETNFSLEVLLKSIAVKGPTTQQPDWKQFSCVFIPKGDGGQRVHYDVHTEDLGNGNTLKLSDLLSASSMPTTKILGRTYDISQVAYFDVELRNASTGRVFSGRFGDKVSVKDPRNFSVRRQEVMVLLEKENKEMQLHLTMELQVVAIHRAARLKRLLAETFRTVGMDFEARRINESESVAKETPSTDNVQRFLWEVCKAYTFPGRNTTQELLAQVHRMERSTKMHWKFTPQLLGFIMEHAFLFGDKDRFSYDDAAALDSVMSRWSLVLQHVNDAKSQLIGHLHGTETPQLIHTLMSECDWTGFEFASLPSASVDVVVDQESEKETVIHAGTKVHALLSHGDYLHAGVAVDVKLANGQYVAGTIISECESHSFDVAFCTSAKVREEEDGYFSDDEELPPLVVGQTVFVCAIAHGVTLTSEVAPTVASMCKAGCTGHVRAIDEAGHASTPYRIEFDDIQPDDKKDEVWVPRVWLDSMFQRVVGEDLSVQLAKDDFVRVASESKDGLAVVEPPHPAKILKNHRNGRYDVQYLDSASPDSSSTVTIETDVSRGRLEPVSDKVLAEGEVSKAYLTPVDGSKGFVIAYDVLLKNGNPIEALARSQLRVHHEVFPSDKCLLAAVYVSEWEMHDRAAEGSVLAQQLKDLFASDQLIKAYVMLPAQPMSFHLRDPVTNKLLQSKLKERDADKPRFVDFCHGYKLGENLSEIEKAKLMQVYKTSALIRGKFTATSEQEEFAIGNCFCVYLAPQPQIELHGMLRISVDYTNPSSTALFKTLVAMAEHDVMKLFQRLLRSTASEHMPLNRKERVVHMKSVDIYEADQQLCVVFEIGVPHNNRGSLESAVQVAHADAVRILERLSQVKFLTALPAVGDTSPDSMIWHLEKEVKMQTGKSGSVAPTPALRVQILDKKGLEHSLPSLTLELLPLDDLRLSIQDMTGKSWEVCLPMDRILVEAQVRRFLVPYHVAEVVGEMDADQASIPKPLAQQTNQRSRRHSQLLSRPTQQLKLKKGSSGMVYNVRFQKDKDVRMVDVHDIKLDTLRVNVLEASELSLKENMGSGDIEVEVMLRSRDFLAHAEGEQALKTPFGVILAENGDICKDSVGAQYPHSSSQRLIKDNSTSWVGTKEAKPLVFCYPGIDMERVTGFTVRLLTKDTKKLIGTTFIAMSEVPLTTDDSSAVSEFSVEKKSKRDINGGVKWVTSMLLPSKKQKVSIQAESNLLSFSLYRSDDGVSNVVGKIRLELERSRKVQPQAKVLARRLLTEADAWKISSYELLVLTLHQHDNQLLRGLLSTSMLVRHGSLQLLSDPIEQELQLQKIVNVMLISHAMELIYATRQHGQTAQSLKRKDGTVALSSPRMIDQMKQLMDQTKWLIEDTAAEFGIHTRGKRLQWSGDGKAEEEEIESRKQFVVVKANVANSATRVRRTMLKLYEMYRLRYIPTLQRLYKLDADGDHIDVKAGEQLLAFFEKEVEDLDEEDEAVYRRVYRRLRLIKIARVLQDIMHTTLLVTVMNHDQNMGDEAIGTTYIPLIDLLDRLEHDNFYGLTKKKKHVGLLGNRPASPSALAGTSTDTTGTPHGKIHLRLQMTYSESSLLEQATTVYRYLKEKYIAQYENSRRHINAAVVPAQRRRWITVKGYLDTLKEQSTGKLHWEHTPVLLSLVWDIFMATESTSPRKKPHGDEDEEQKHLQGLAEKTSEYRSAVVQVHKRWANLQPLLEELLQIQSAAQIHAQRTPIVLNKVAEEVDGLDLVLSTAWQQVHNKWMELYNALEELVKMKERTLHMARAPQLLKLVTQRCSKGLSERHADAIANVQFRWMAITQTDGPLNELRLTERKGLHWRRTHELVLLLNEQCEGFAETDATALDIVEKRWSQVQEWLDLVLQMQQQHTIDCESTPFILKKMHLLETRHKASSMTGSKAFVHVAGSPKKRLQVPRSPSIRDRVGSDAASSPRSSSISSTAGGSFAADAVIEVDRLEGLAEWYAIEEAKRELERIPYHRITTDFDKNDQLRHFKDGKDTRLMISLEEMALTPANIRAALVDRGVIPLMASYDGLSPLASSEPLASPTKSQGLPKDLLEEIQVLEQSIDAMHMEQGSTTPGAAFVKWNPERVAELYLVIESLGKSDLLWRIEHAVNTNHELGIPSDYGSLIQEMQLRQIQTTEVKELIHTLLVTMQKEELVRVGVEVPPTANYKDVERLMRRHQVNDVMLPVDTVEIQRLLHKYGMDKKGEPVFLRGMRIGTQSSTPDENNTASDVAAGASASTPRSKASTTMINTGLGLVDSKIEQLRKALLMEALRKRNSLIKTFPCETNILTAEELAECTEVDMSGDYMTLIERFQQLLIHESYTKRLAEFASMDRCMRALLRVPKDQVVTKEDIAKELQIRGSRFRLPLEAFTQDELLEAASLGKIRTPSEHMLARCPTGKNAKAMAYYAAVSHAALVFQETVRFRDRLDAISQQFVDSFSFDTGSSVDGLSVPKTRKNMSMKAFFVDWLLGSEDSVVKIQRRLGVYHRQRLEWASAAFTLRNRWYQRGYGWCDDASKCAGVKVLLHKLLLFENANKMHMIETEALLSEVNEKCVKLRDREREAKERLEHRYAANLERLATLVSHAEKCMNNRKLHTEETPTLLHAIEQACVVPFGLHPLHKHAYHVVSTYWTETRAHLAELVHMQKQGTFSIERTPELLSAMEYHTEGIAGADVLNEDKVVATASSSTAPVHLQQQYLDKKVDEIRRGQRKQKSTLRLNLEDANTEKDIVLEDLNEDDGSSNQWQSLSPSKRVVQPLSPRDKQTSWKVASDSATKQAIVLENKVADKRRKSSIGDELRELLRSPSKWLMASTEPPETIRPEIFFPREVSLHLSQSTAPGVATAAPGGPIAPSSDASVLAALATQ